MTTAMRPTQKRVSEIRSWKRRKDFSLSRFKDDDLYAIGFEDAYACDVRDKDPYRPRREPPYMRGFDDGLAAKRRDIAVALLDPFSDESRTRAAEARLGARLVREKIAKHDANRGRYGEPAQPFHEMLRYAAPLRRSSVSTPVHEWVRNRLSGHFTPYLSAWRRAGLDSPEVLPADAPSWPIYRAASESVDK